MRPTSLGILGVVVSFLGAAAAAAQAPAQAQGVRHPRPAGQLQLAVTLSERTRPYQPVNDAGAPAAFADAVLELPHAPVPPAEMTRLELAASPTDPDTLIALATALATQQRHFLARSAQIAAAADAASDPRR